MLSLVELGLVANSAISKVSAVSRAPTPDALGKGLAGVDDEIVTASRLDRVGAEKTDSIISDDFGVNLNPSLMEDVKGGGTNSATQAAIRLRVLANVEASADARSTSNINKLERFETAYDFYRQSGFDANRTIDHMRGIDFSYPVDVVTISKGTEVIQYQIPGAPVGNYFALPGTQGNQLGFYTSGRQATTFISTGNVQVLRSTASSTIDDWSMKAYGWEIEAPGGATQFFTRSKSWMKK